MPRRAPSLSTGWRSRCRRFALVARRCAARRGVAMRCDALRCDERFLQYAVGHGVVNRLEAISQVAVRLKQFEANPDESMRPTQGIGRGIRKLWPKAPKSVRRRNLTTKIGTRVTMCMVKSAPISRKRTRELHEAAAEHRVRRCCIGRVRQHAAETDGARNRIGPVVCAQGGHGGRRQGPL